MDREEKQKELRKRLKMMKEARSGRSIPTNTEGVPSISKKERRKMKKVVKSSQVEELLKTFHLEDPGTKKCLQKAIQEGRISTLEDLAKFISERTNKNVTATDLMQVSSSTDITSTSAREAEELMAVGGPTRPRMKPPTVIFSETAE